jgi:hypothetical protein
MALREILALFDVKVDDKELKGAEKNISGMVGLLGNVAKAVAGAFAFEKVVGFTSEMIDLGGALNDTSVRLGISTDELQSFGFAAKLSGVGTEEMTVSLSHLSRAMGEANSGNAAAKKSFADLHIATKNVDGSARSVTDVVTDVATSLEGVKDQGKKTAIVMDLFGRSGGKLLPLLSQGGKGVAAVVKQFKDLGFALDEDFIKKADDAGDQIDILKFGITALKGRIVSAMLPAILSWSGKLTGLVSKFLEVTKNSNLMAIAIKALGVASAATGAKMALAFGKKLGFISDKAGIMGSITGLLKFGLIAGLIILVVLALEDLYTMIKGGKSVIGDLITDLLGVGEKDKLVKDLQKAFDSLKQAWVEAGPSIKELGKILLEVFVAVLPVIAKVTVAVLDMAVEIIETVALLGKLASAVASGKGVKELEKILKDADIAAGKRSMARDERDSVKMVKEDDGTIRPLADSLAEDAARAKNTLQIPEQTIRGALSPNAPAFVPSAGFQGPVPLRKEVKQTVNITNNIKSTDPKEAAKETGEEMNKNLATAKAALETGG